MKAFYRQNQWFFGPYILLLLTASTQLIIRDKGILVLFFESIRNPEMELFFTAFTFLGDGLTALVICLSLMFVSRKMFFTISGALIINTLVIQSLKAIIQAPRPHAFFRDLQVALTENQWIDTSYMLSMPSGHTALAFCLFGLLAFYSKKSSFGYLFLTLAAGVGLSRTFLAQHFLEDIVAGSFIGVSIAILTYKLAQRKMPVGSKFDKPLIPWKF